jgi:hypothetical protein
MRSYRPVLTVVVLLALLAAGRAVAVPVPPVLRALELPAGASSIAATDPLMVAILSAATSTLGGTITWTVPTTFPIGKTQVTWHDSADNSNVTKYIYVYPYGYQVLGPSNNLRIFEHNGARHILYDRDNRVHTIYCDGRDVWYRLGVRSGNRLTWHSPVRVNDNSTPMAMSSPPYTGTRGETFAMVYDAQGRVNLQCTWSTTSPVNRAIVTRRLVVDAAGNVTTGSIVYTGVVGSFQCIVADSTNRLHLAVEVYSAIAYSWSNDGQTWSAAANWYATGTQCTAYRFPNLLVDSKDRLHLLWQAEGYQGYSGSRLWWVGLYTSRNPQTGTWATPANVLSGLADWHAPTSGQQILFAYPNMLLDDQNNLHVSWHGTARSYVFAQDDVFYMEKIYSPATDTWAGWTNYTCLHKRIPPADGEDANYTWVPSQAYKPGTSDLYTVIMFGLGDDEVDDPAVNLTDGMLKTRIGGSWQAGFQNVTQTTDLRSWYPNVPSRVLVDPNGHSWLDMIWIDGTKDDYNVLFRRMDLGGGLAGDCNGDGSVDVVDLLTLVYAFGTTRGDPAFDAQADLNFDDAVDVTDLLEIVLNFGSWR